MPKTLGTFLVGSSRYSQALSPFRHNPDTPLLDRSAGRIWPNRPAALLGHKGPDKETGGEIQ
jgi:hypothetical protein